MSVRKIILTAAGAVALIIGLIASATVFKHTPTSQWGPAGRMLHQMGYNPDEVFFGMFNDHGYSN